MKSVPSYKNLNHVVAQRKEQIMWCYGESNGVNIAIKDDFFTVYQSKELRKIISEMEKVAESMEALEEECRNHDAKMEAEGAERVRRKHLFEEISASNYSNRRVLFATMDEVVETLDRLGKTYKIHPKLNEEQKFTEILGGENGEDFYILVYIKPLPE